MISVKLKRVRKAVQKVKCENAIRRSVQELLKHLVDGAMGPSVDTLRARFHALPERRPQEVETMGAKWLTQRASWKGPSPPENRRDFKAEPDDRRLLATWFKRFIAEQAVQPHREHSNRLQRHALGEEED